MTDKRTKFIRKTQIGKGWEYGYAETGTRLKEHKLLEHFVTEHIVGQASTMQEATAAWLDRE